MSGSKPKSTTTIHFGAPLLARVKRLVELEEIVSVSEFVRDAVRRQLERMALVEEYMERLFTPDPVCEIDEYILGIDCIGRAHIMEAN